MRFTVPAEGPRAPPSRFTLCPAPRRRRGLRALLCPVIPGELRCSPVRGVPEGYREESGVGYRGRGYRRGMWGRYREGGTGEGYQGRGRGSGCGGEYRRGMEVHW